MGIPRWEWSLRVPCRSRWGSTVDRSPGIPGSLVIPLVLWQRSIRIGKGRTMARLVRSPGGARDVINASNQELKSKGNKYGDSDDIS